MNVYARKSLRHKIAEAAALWPQVAESKPYLLNDLGGVSPVVTVENLPIVIEETPRDPDFPRVAVTFWLRRDDTQTCEEAEDLLDDLLVFLAEYVFDTLVGDFFQDSQLGYEELSGTIYRYETHFIQAPVVA